MEESGEPYELVIMGDRSSRLADAEHMARHPMGRVPVLEDEGKYIFESRAICLYAAEKYPKSGLMPAPGTIERGEVYQWSFFAYNEIQARVFHIRMGTPEAAEGAKEALAQALTALETRLGREFLVGDRLTVADVPIASALAGIRRLGAAELSPTLSGYLDALDARPAKQRAQARNPTPAAA